MSKTGDQKKHPQTGIMVETSRTTVPENFKTATVTAYIICSHSISQTQELLTVTQ